MKKILFLFVTLIVSTVTWAGPVSKDEAMTKAQAFVSSKSQQLGGPRRVKLAHQQMTLAQTAGDALYYVFNIGEKNGFVFVSGDDRTPAILGYCDDGAFDPDNMPDNMRAWLQGYADQLAWLQAHPEATIDDEPVSITDNNPVTAQPGMVKMPAKAPVKTAVAPLIQSMWDQGDPYYLSCPSVTYRVSDGQGGYVNQTQYCLTGCVATAMAQVMKFWEWPKQTKAAINGSYKTWTFNSPYDGTLTMTAMSFAAGTAIDWDNMLNVYGSGATTAQKAAVAELMAMCGSAVQMDYGFSASGATVYASDMMTYFDYCATARDIYRGDFTYTEWNNLIYADVAAGRPVLYSGSSSGGGHQFVVDGYDDNELFHVNWGWSGESNGYFLLSILNPHNNSGSGASSSNDGYNMYNWAIIGLEPNTGQVETVKMTSKILSVSIENRTVTCSYFNGLNNTYSFDFGLGLVDNVGNIEPISYYYVEDLASGWGYSSLEMSIGNLPDGTYRIAPISREMGTSTWYPNIDPEAHYVEAVVSGGTVTSMQIYPDQSTPDLTATNITFPDPRQKDWEQKVVADVSCTRGEFYGPLYLFANQTGTLEGDPVSRVGMTVLAGDPVMFEASFTPNATGTWYVWIAKDSDGNEVIGSSSVEITEGVYSNTIDLQFDHQILNLSADGGCLVGEKMDVQVTATNPSTTNSYAGFFKFLVYKWEGSHGTCIHEYNDYMIIPAGKSIVLNHIVDGLEIGGEYSLRTCYIYNNDWRIIDFNMIYQTYTVQPAPVPSITIFDKEGNSTNIVATASYEIPEGTTAVDLQGNSTTTAITWAAGVNPNVLFFIDQGATVPTGTNGNIVEGDVAQSITLVDGYDFYSPHSFMATDITYTRTFTGNDILQKVPTGGTLGWTTITLPFMVSSVTVDLTKDDPSYPSDYLIDWFQMDNDMGKNFWVMEFRGETGTMVNFDYAMMMEGGRPYLLGVPGPSWGADNDLTGYPITFHGQDALIFNAEPGVLGDNFKMKGTLMKEMLSGDKVYALNPEGSAFEKAILGVEVNPFRAYFEATSTANPSKQLTIGFGDDDEGETTALGGIQVNSSTVQQFNSSAVYDLSGRKVMSTLPDSETPTLLRKGIYIVNGKKVIIK